MNDKELAAKVEALRLNRPPHRYGSDALMRAHEFVRDWRVAGALMERCRDRDWLVNMAHDGAVFCFTDLDEPRDCCESYDESLPRAIIEACVTALEES